MNNTKSWKSILEGIVLIALSVICLILSIQVRSNPVSLTGILNVLTQARTVPMAASILMLIMGVLFTMELARGTAKMNTLPKEEWIRILVLTVMTTVYLLVTYYTGFVIPTLLYGAAMLFFLNWKQRSPVLMVVVAVIYTAVAVFGIPMILNLTLDLW